MHAETTEKERFCRKKLQFLLSITVYCSYEREKVEELMNTVINFFLPIVACTAE